MATAKYKDFYQQMMTKHGAEFAAFKTVHDKFRLDRKKWRKQFDLLGKPLVRVIEEWERRLCSGMERGDNARYSMNLSEKFWGEIKRELPMIELVGVKSNLG